MATRHLLVQNKTVPRAETIQSGDVPAIDVPVHIKEATTPTPVAGYGAVYVKADGLLYYQDGSGNERVVGGGIEYVSYGFVSRDAATGANHVGGFYEWPDTDANLTNASTTVNLGTANSPHAAHACVVAGAAGSTDGSDLVLTVTGTSIDDTGTRTGSDSEVVVADCTAAATDQYFETTKKWIGQVTYTLSSTGGATFSFDFNYGFSNYEDYGNRDFTIKQLSAVGLCNVADAGFEMELLLHSSTGWTYAATGFVPGGTVIAQFTTDYSTESDLKAGEEFSWRRTNLNQAATGSTSQGYVFRITTSVNNSVSYLNVKVGVTL